MGAPPGTEFRNAVRGQLRRAAVAQLRHVERGRLALPAHPVESGNVAAGAQPADAGPGTVAVAAALAGSLVHPRSASVRSGTRSLVRTIPRKTSASD